MIGRDKKNWSADVNELTHDALMRQVRSHGALRSQGVDFEWNPETGDGRIFVGGFRLVGTFRTALHVVRS